MKRIHQYSTQHRAHSKISVVLIGAGGNSASRGQFVLGQPMNRANKLAADRLRCVSELFPSIIDMGSGEDAQPSCSAAEALDRQEPFINNAQHRDKVIAGAVARERTRLIAKGLTL